MMNATDWYRWQRGKDGVRQWVFNHRQNGRIEGDKPQPIKPEFVAQQAWANMTWRKECVGGKQNGRSKHLRRS